jgi:DNA polymerase
VTTRMMSYVGEDRKKHLKKSTQFTANLGDKGRVGLYGGMLAENTTQATARDIFAEGLLRVLRAGYHVPFHVHDELVIEAPLEEDPKGLQAILAQTPKWIEGCPVTCGAVEAPHYLKD